MKTETKKIAKTVSQLFTVLSLCSVLAFTACTDQGESIATPGNPTGSDVAITVTIPRTQIPATRSIADGEGEAVVDKIDVLVFEPGATDSPDVLSQHASGTIISQSNNNEEDYVVTFLVRLTYNVQATSLAVLANVPEEIIGDIETLTNKDDILKALIHTTGISGAVDGKWKADATNYTAIPMYGEHAVAGGIKAGMNITGIILTRMLARIDVVNNASDFVLSKVYVMNYNTEGYIAPAWNATGGLLEGLPVAPMIPPTSTSAGNAMEYPYNHNNGLGLRGEIYTYEAVAATGDASHSTAICLILEGEYKGVSYFYRVDFATFGSLQVDYMPLWRNHSYIVDVIAANGIGYDSLTDALNSLGVINNLKTELLVLDDGGTASTVFNGQNYLSIKTNGVELSPMINRVVEVECTTDYSGGWEIDYAAGVNNTGIQYTVGSGDWLSVNKEASPTDPRTAKLMLETLLQNGGPINREATVYLKAGRLRHTLKVTQLMPFIRITDMQGNMITNLSFTSKTSQIGIDPPPQQFKVVWEPDTEAVILNKIPGGNALAWQDILTNALTSLPVGEPFIFTIDPMGITQTEVDGNPFIEKSVKLEFTLEGGSTAAIDIEQIHYQIKSDNFNSSYSLRGETFSFQVQTNTQWKVERVSDPDGILASLDNTQQGGPNVDPGDALTFKMIDTEVEAKQSKVITVTLTDPSGKADNVDFIIMGANCGSNGVEVLQKIGNNVYKTHEYFGLCWMVQNSMEGTATHKEYNNQAGLVNGYYYSYEQAVNTTVNETPCPSGWRLPIWEEGNKIKEYYKGVNDENKEELDPNNAKRWWAGSDGSIYDAFAGYFRQPNKWSGWNLSAIWWMKTNSVFYGLLSFSDGDIDVIEFTNYFASVRCVKDPPY